MIEQAEPLLKTIGNFGLKPDLLCHSIRHINVTAMNLAPGFLFIAVWLQPTVELETLKWL